MIIPLNDLNMINMKRLLLIVLAVSALAACAEKIDDPVDVSVENGEIEESYIAINLMSSDPGTRADDGVYQDGLASERAVRSAYFFFYQNDTPFSVNVSDGAVTGPGTTGANWLEATLPDTGTKDTPNVSDIKGVVLLLKNYKGQYPNQIIAVLNWTPTVGKAYTLDELKAETAIATTYDATKYFVMSNSVYADAANKEIIATPLTLSNIFTDKDAAEDSPIKIHVERIAAKVTVTTSADTPFDLDNPAGASDIPVYAKIEGWELYNDYQTSYLLKDIDPAWTAASIGFNWNDVNYYRSYWAISPTLTDFPDNTFTWNGGFAAGLDTDVTAGTYADNTYTYCGENTFRNEADRTKVILKARLVDAGGNPVELAKWYGAEYLGEADLRTAVANTLKNTLFYKASETQYIGISPEDIECVTGGGAGAPAGVTATEVYFQLSTTGESRAWYTYDSTHGYVSLGDESINATKTNEHLASVPSAIIYKAGQTYYHFDIKHLGAEGKTAEYGIVRNHIYSINVNSIKGYGSPVYDPNIQIVEPEDPDDPTETESFVAAEVRILSWRLVSQGVDIVPQS